MRRPVSRATIDPMFNAIPERTHIMVYRYTPATVAPVDYRKGKATTKQAVSEWLYFLAAATVAPLKQVR